MKQKITIIFDRLQNPFKQEDILKYFPISQYEIGPLNSIIDIYHVSAMGSWEDRLYLINAIIEFFSPNFIIGIGNVSTLLEPIRGHKKILISPRFDLSWIKKQLELKEKYLLSGKDESALGWEERSKLYDIRSPLEMIGIFNNEVHPILFNDITDYDRQNTYCLFESSILGRADRDVFVQHYHNSVLVPPGSTQNFGRIADTVLSIIGNNK